ncbi:MAG: EAL domain-containing protein [Actinobacteria bacterium]|nr:EAL domain-containing protein [Actinomycetota bacterium]
MFAFTWQLSTWLGWSLVVLSVVALSPSTLEAMGAPLAMVAGIIVLSELRPVVMSRVEGNPVSISLAFVFAAMYVWGPAPALGLMAGAVILSELLQRKPVWKLMFNVGQYSISVAAAWLVLVVAGATASPFTPMDGLTIADLPWVVLSWAVYHVVNVGLVAGLAHSDGETWWQSFTDEFWFYTVSGAAVLALSPIIAVVLLTGSNAWILLPLLLLPLLAVQRAAQMSRENERQAMHDPLTGLPNRALLADRIEQALARGTRQHGRVTVLFLDVDLFKVVNDSLGHAAGDRLLVEMATRLGHFLRPGDTLARFGGDEFVIVCDDVPEDEVAGLVDRVTEALSDPFEFEGRAVTVTASIGIAVAGDTTDADTLLRDADAAMYRAKAAGRNQAIVFDQGMHDQAAARLEAEFGLRRALEKGELRVYFQPVIDLHTESTVGFEALVRWKHPVLGLLSPDEFVAVAEETGLIVPLGEWVLHQSLRQTAQWRATIPGSQDLWVAVNLSARQLRAPNLVQMLTEALSEVDMPPSAVRLEITESVVMDEIGPTIAALDSIRSLGISLAVDDFGTGYSSLSYLKSLPVTTIKIDRSFVDGLGGTDPSAPALVDAIISMARALDLEVIAEGVETPAQARTLRQLGARVAQGYLWSRPIEAARVPEWLTQHAPVTTRA